MRFSVPSVLTAALLAAVAAGCSKSDASKPTGTAAAATPPEARGGVASGGPAVGGGPAGVIGGPAGAAEGAVAAGGPDAPDDSFLVETAEVAGVAGGENVARVVVRPGKGFHINKDYPTKLTLELPERVSSPKAVLEPADAEAFTDNQLVFAVKLTAAGKGAFTIPATLKFAVCTDSTCNPKKRSIALSLTAN